MTKEKVKVFDKLKYRGDIYFFDKATFDSLKKKITSKINAISLFNKEIPSKEFVIFKRTIEENGYQLVTYSNFEGEVIVSSNSNSKEKEYFISTTRDYYFEMSFKNAIELTNLKKSKPKKLGTLCIPSKIMTVVAIDETSNIEYAKQLYQHKTSTELLQKETKTLFKKIEVPVPNGEIVIYSCFDKSYRKNYEHELVYPETLSDYELPNAEDLAPVPPNIHFLYFKV